MPYPVGVNMNSCHCVTPIDIGRDFLNDEGGAMRILDWRQHTPNNFFGSRSSMSSANITISHGNQHNHRQVHPLPPLPPLPPPRKRKERPLLRARPNQASSSTSSPTTSPVSKFQKTLKEAAGEDRFESVLDRPFIYWFQLDQVLQDSLAIMDAGWKNPEARSRMITHLIHFLELKVVGTIDMDDDPDGDVAAELVLLMPTRVIEQAWRAVVLETELYQQITYHIQDFHSKPRKVIPYSSLRRQQASSSTDVHDRLQRTQSFFQVYFMERMPESIQDEMPVEEVRSSSRRENPGEDERPGGFLLPSFVKQTTSYAMADLQQPVLGEEDDDDDDDLIGLDLLGGESNHCHHIKEDCKDDDDETATTMEDSLASFSVVMPSEDSIPSVVYSPSRTTTTAETTTPKKGMTDDSFSEYSGELLYFTPQRKTSMDEYDPIYSGSPLR